MSRRVWVDRKFALGLPVTAFADVLERVRGTPARIEDRVRDLGRARLVRRAEDAWSIQEHIGHLFDLEELWDTRLDELMAGVEKLSAADMSNRRTYEADHNERDVAELLADFRTARQAIVDRLDAMSEEDRSRTGLHPRLEQPMSTTDLCFFVAEHDDHHLAAITEILRSEP